MHLPQVHQGKRHQERDGDSAFVQYDDSLPELRQQAVPEGVGLLAGLHEL
jgi:hypothetical protein